MSWRNIDTSSRRALVFTPMETRRNVLVDAAVHAEALGYEAIIVPEGWGLDASIVLSEIAMRTSRIKLVAGILSIWNRTPATIAMTAATLHDLSEGRFVLGLGASTATLAEGLHDVAFSAPSAKLRATVTEVRALLHGERASTSNGAHGLRLGQAPHPGLPIWVAGLGPNSVTTAAQLGDGWLPAMLPRVAFNETRDAARESATVRCEVITCVMAGVDHGQTSGRSEAEQLVGWYLTGMGPFYGDVAAAHGFETDVAAVRAANPRPRPGSIVWPREARRLLDQLSVFGDPADVGAGFDSWDRLADVVAVGVGPGEVDAVSALIEAAAPGQTAWSQTSTTTSAAVLTAPDGCTTFRTSSIPTARQIADWCHPRSDPGPRLCDSVAGSVAPPAQHHPVERPSTHAAKHPTDLTTRLLGIWAHPDDEAYLSAGLMARTIADGGHVTVVAITDGDAGFPDDDPRSSEQRAAQRRRELRAAMALIGVHDVRFLGIADGAVATTPADRLVAEIGHIIRDVDPDAILTFGPDGITGHDDHVANSDLVTRAWLDTRIGELWYAAKTNEWLAEWRELHDDFGVWMTEEPTGVRSEDLELIVGLEGTELDTKRAVLAEHRSQTVRLAAAFGEAAYRRWISEEVFRRPTDQELSRYHRLVGSVTS